MRKFLFGLILALSISPAAAQNPTCPTRPFGDNTNACASTAFVQAALGGLAPITIRERLLASRDYFVRTDGNDSNTGLVNSAGGAFLTVQRCLSVVSMTLDTNAQNVQCRVQGGTYTANIVQPHWVGYAGNGFDQFTVLCENGTVTLTSSSATYAIFATQSNAPIRWQNCTTTNPAASGLQIEVDDGGFVVLDGHTFGATGAGGIQLIALLNSRVIMKAGTITVSGDSGTWAYGRSGSLIINQPGTTLALGAGRVMSNALVDMTTGAQFANTGLTVTGSLGSSSVPYKLDYNTNAEIDDVSILSGISGAGAAIAPPLSQGKGGTGSLSGVWSATSLTLTGTSASILAVGRQGATDPVLKVDASTASVADGISVTGAASGSGTDIQAISPGSNSALRIFAKGSSGLVLNANAASTGALTLGSSGNANAINAFGNLTITKASGTLSESLTSSAADVQVSYTGTSGGVSYFIKDSAAGSNQKFFRLQSSAGVTTLADLTDAGATQHTFISMNHSSGQSSFPTATAATSAATGGAIFSGGIGVAGAGWFGTYINTTTNTVSGLPACGAGIKGARTFVSDNNTALAFAAVITTGGTIQTPVYCDGTVWRQGANDNWLPAKRKLA